MTGLVIPAHSRSQSRTAIVVLTLLAAASFAVGFVRQFESGGPSPFPTTGNGAAGGLAATNAIPDATPAPALQVADSAPAVVRHAPAPPDLSAELPEPTAAVPSVFAADAAPGADASAAAPDLSPPTTQEAAPPV
jgi:hypothetical protein